MPLQRYYSHYKRRPASYFNPVSGGLFSENSRVHTSREHAPIECALQMCDTPVLYLLPDKDNRYPSQHDLYSIPGCEVKKYLSKRGTATVCYQGKTIDLYPISVWFNVKPGNSLKEVIQAHRMVQSILENNFQPQKVHAGKEEKFSIPLLATPGQMGGDLLKRTLPYNREYSNLPDEIAEIIVENTTQGHIETFYHGQATIDNLHYRDGRWMYAAHLRHLPTGRIQHDSVPEIELTAPSKTGTRGIIPGYYKVAVRLPNDWNHIGLLPLLTNNKPTYPRRPGMQFVTWATAHEIILAQGQGWGIEVLERILWPDTHKEPEPLRAWGEKLRYIRMELAETYPEPFRTYIRDAARSILLQTVGSFFRTTKEFDAYTSDPNMIPEEATSELLLEGDVWKYTVPAMISPLQKILCQPHWAGYVWGLTRWSLAKNALQVPFNQLIALRVDAIWANCEMDFEDTGKVGQFVEKSVKQRSDFAWPKNNSQMVALVQKVRV